MMRTKDSRVASTLSRCLWALPGSFAIARALGWDYGLRCVLFHDISSSTSVFTDGLRVTMPPDVFAGRVDYLKRHYHPVTLEQVLATAEGATLPERALLVTFDDAYSSVVRNAAPILAAAGMPAVFFINAGFIDGAALGLDNLLCYTINASGMDKLDRAAQGIGEARAPFRDLTDVIQNFTSGLGAVDVARFREAILEQLEQDPLELARSLGIYMTSSELCSLEGFGFELGNHTLHHAWCRSLDQEGLERQLRGGRDELQRIGGRSVRSFSVPYGEARDLTDGARDLLRSTGQRALFLVDGLTNGTRLTLDRLHRVSLEATQDHVTFAELEVLPRLRGIRNVLRSSAR